MSNEQIGTTLTKENREKVLAALRLACSPQGFVEMKDLPRRLFDAGIPWSTMTGGMKLEEWLGANFPEFQISGGRGRIVNPGPEQLSPALRDRIRKLVEEGLERDGNLLLSVLGGTLRQNGIDRRAYSSQSLAEWIISLIPDIKKSPDGLYIFRGTEVPAASAASGEGDYPPAAKGLSSPDQEEQTRQMHAIAFMGWWSNNTKILRRYTGCSGSEPQVWSGIVARHMTDVLMGKAPCIRSYLENGKLRVAFHSGVYTAEGEPLYCVLIDNARDPDGRYQPMLMEGFGYPGEESELGAWLKDHVGMLVPHKQEENDTMEELAEVCTYLEQRREELQAMEEEYLETVRRGGNLSIPCWTAIKNYRKNWNRAQRLLEEMGAPEELSTLEEIRRWCDEQNRFGADLKKVRELFGELRTLLTDFAERNQAAVGAFSDGAGELDEAFRDFENTLSVEGIRKVLEPYGTLLECMDPERVDPSVFGAIQPLSAKFGFNCMLLMGQKLWNPDFYEQYRKKVREIQLKLTNLESLCVPREAEQPEQKVLPKADLLLTEVCQRKYGAVWGAGGGRDLLENLILEDRIPEAVELAANEESMLELGYDTETRSRILEHLEEKQALPGGCSLYNMGCRLLTVLGSRNETAERYLLMGIMADAPGCAAKLLELYRTGNQEEKFRTLWDAYGTEAAFDLENHLYYANILAHRAPEMLGVYLRERPWLMHLEDGIYDLRRALETAGDRTLLGELELYASRMAGAAQPDPLEEAVIEDRMEQVRELMDAPERLIAMGYDAAEIGRISRALLEENRPVGNDPYQVGMRLELFQGNRNKRAESWLWKSLACDDNPVKAGSLIRILAREERWSECIHLYEHYGDAAGKQAEPRRAWLTALLHQTPDRAAALLEPMLQDVLFLLVQDPATLKAVQATRESGDQKTARLFEQVLELKEALGREYVRSVVLHDSGLRDLITDPEALSQMGFSDEQIRKARTLYQTGNYAQGADALSVAKRVAGLVGPDSPEAELFCRFVLPDPEAVALLWEIYEASGERDRQGALMDAYPLLREQHPEEYGDWLFLAEKYELFLQWADGREISKEQMLRIAVARLATDPESEPELPVNVCDPEAAARLSRMLAEKGRLEVLEDWLIGAFRELLELCDRERLTQIMTGCGKLEEAQMAAIQSHAVEKARLLPALYYYNVLGIGDLKAFSEKFYGDMLDKCTRMDDGEGYLVMDLMGKLYPAHREELQIRRRVMNLQELLDRRPVPEGLAEKVAKTLEECAAEPAVLRTLLEQVAESACAAAPAVVRSVIGLTGTEALQADGLLYLHRVAAQQSKRAILEEDLREALCEGYLRAMNQDRFPGELVEEAAEICRRILRSDRSNRHVAYCLYRLQELLGRTHEAAYALRYLAGCSADEMGSSLSALVSVAVEEQWKGGIPDVTELFLRVLEDCSPERIMEYCKFCGSFAEAQEEDISAAQMKLVELRSQSNEEEREQFGTLTRTEGQAMIRALYAAPESENGQYWEGCLALPELSPRANGNLLYCRAVKTSDHWHLCVRYCAENGLDDLLIQALWQWVKVRGINLKGVRSFISLMVKEDPNYFARWTDEEDRRVLLEILQILCGYTRTVANMYDASAAHITLSAVSYLAVSMGGEEGLRVLEENLIDDLTASHTEIGVATVIRLLYLGRTAHARHFLSRLSQSNAPITCGALMHQLDVLSHEELEQWAREPENRVLMELFLEDGNRPAAQDIQKMTARMIESGEGELCARTILKLLEVFPGDYAFNDCLFILCKCGLEEPLPVLHMALRALLVPPVRNASYYRRSSEWYAYCLAAVNAVVKARRVELKVGQLGEGYDFNVLAGDYLRMKMPNTTIETVAKVNLYQKELTAKLANQVPAELDLLCKGILGMVTADWTELLKLISEKEVSDETVRRYLQVGSVKDFPDGELDALGLCRSLLRVVEDMPREQAEAFLDKIQRACWFIANGGGRNGVAIPQKRRQVMFAKEFYKAEILKKAELSLRFPLEEYSMFHDLFSEKIAPCRETDPELLFYRLWVVAAMQDYGPILQYQYFPAALKAFREGYDHTARAYYDALAKLADAGLYGSNIKLSPNIVKAQYKAYSRLCALLTGDRKVIEEVAAPDYGPWRCINMIMALLSSPRAEVAMQLSLFFTGENRKLAQALIRGVDPNVPETEKMMALRSMERGLPKAYLALMMRQKYQDGTNSFYIRDMVMLEEIERIYRETASAEFARDHFNMKNPRNIRSFHILILKFDWINSSALKQLPVAEPESPAVPVVEDVPVRVETEIPDLPGFACEVPASVGQEDPAALIRQWRAIPRFKHNLEHRLELSRTIYSRMKDGDRPREELAALLRFGMDFYAYHNDLGTPEDLRLARRAVLELAVYSDAMRYKLGPDALHGSLREAAVEMENMVENLILFNILQKGYSTIQALTEDFSADRTAYELLKHMVQDDQYRKAAVETVFAVLDRLVLCYNDSGDNQTMLRQGLVQARTLAGTINYPMWQLLREKLVGMIQREITDLDRRPQLQVKILNTGKQWADDYLYGVIRNEGSVAANKLTIQAIYGNGASDALMLSGPLEPKASCTFKLRYHGNGDAQCLAYELRGSYCYEGSDQPASITASGELRLCDYEEPDFPVGMYNTQTIVDFQPDGNGDVVNDQFFGRKQETRDLRNLFRSGRFPSFQNAVVYGIRRAGKTTLLNYVRAYVDAYYSGEAIIVKVDCLRSSGPRPIYALFVDRVLDAIRAEYPDIAATEQWDTFRRNWTLGPEAEDLAPEKLELFFRELKNVTGKGLVLMLDEVDNFFTSVEQQTSVDSHLFQTLSNMLCSAGCQEALHLILCGSKYLLRYRTGDGGISQFFQRIGDVVIEVGLIPKEEVRAMLRKPYEEYPEVVFTEEAIDWIWEYTQGLVWHVKLLANMVLRYVRDNGRSVVYPVDVQSRIMNLVQKEYCEQFFDGIGEQDKDRQERLVLDLMQNLCASRSASVTAARLEAVLTSPRLPEGYRLTKAQLDSALRNLRKLKLISFSEADQSYRFSVELYRLYFRTQSDYTTVFGNKGETDPIFIRKREE